MNHQALFSSKDATKKKKKKKKKLKCRLLQFLFGVLRVKAQLEVLISLRSLSQISRINRILTSKLQKPWTRGY